MKLKSIIMAAMIDTLIAITVGIVLATILRHSAPEAVDRAAGRLIEFFHEDKMK